jgi:hypothetical protein
MGVAVIWYRNKEIEGPTNITISSSFLSLSHCLQRIERMLSDFSHKTSLIVIARYLFLDVMKV